MRVLTRQTIVLFWFSARGQALARNSWGAKSGFLSDCHLSRNHSRPDTAGERKRDSSRFAIWRGWPDGGWGGWRADRCGGERGGKQRRRRQSSLHSRIYSSNRERDINLWNMSNLAFSKDIESTNHSPRAPFLYSLPPGEEWESGASERERESEGSPFARRRRSAGAGKTTPASWCGWMVIRNYDQPHYHHFSLLMLFPTFIHKKARMEDQTERPPRFKTQNYEIKCQVHNRHFLFAIC